MMPIQIHCTIVSLILNKHTKYLWGNASHGETHFPLKILSLAGGRGHQFIKCRVSRYGIGKGNEGAAETEQAVSGVCVGDIAHLCIGNVQEIGKLGPVGGGLIEQH